MGLQDTLRKHKKLLTYGALAAGGYFLVWPHIADFITQGQGSIARPPGAPDPQFVPVYLGGSNPPSDGSNPTTPAVNPAVNPVAPGVYQSGTPPQGYIYGDPATFGFAPPSGYITTPSGAAQPATLLTLPDGSTVPAGLATPSPTINYGTPAAPTTYQTVTGTGSPYGFVGATPSAPAAQAAAAAGNPLNTITAVVAPASSTGTYTLPNGATVATIQPAPSTPSVYGVHDAVDPAQQFNPASPVQPPVVTPVTPHLFSTKLTV